MTKRVTNEVKEDIVRRHLDGEITRDQAKSELGNYNSDEELDQYIGQYQMTGKCWS